MINLMKLMRRRATLHGRNMSLEDVSYVAIDTELTGLNEKNDSIVSIGAVKMRGGRIELGRSFYRLVNPATALTASSVIIHEITPSQVVHRPEINSVLSEFLDFCGDDVIVGFCVDIDMEFLNRDTRLMAGHAIQNPVLDIYAIREWITKREALRGVEDLKMPRQYKLYDIARHFGISVNGAHNAMIDAFITAQIFQRFIPVLIASGISTLEELLKLSAKYEGGDRSRINPGISNF